jgi:TIR domain
MASEPPKVLISYSHDSSKHAERALELANRLREDGVDCMIDQYVVVPEEGWPRWMDKQIRDSDFVVMICTETYYKRVMGEEQPGKGFGVRWEGHLIYGEIYRAGTMNTKFVPVLFEGGDPSHVPGAARDTKHYSVHTEGGTKSSTDVLLISRVSSNQNSANCASCRLLNANQKARLAWKWRFRIFRIVTRFLPVGSVC